MYIMDNILDWINFNEGKHYGDLYHGFGNPKFTDGQLFDVLKSILDKGLKFTPAATEGGNQPIPGWYKNKDDDYGGGNLFRNMTGDYFISTSRNPNWYKQGRITLVLDGGSISDRYRIHPYQLGADLRIKTGKRIKENPDKYTMKSYMNLTGKRNNTYEEKIESKKPGFLDPKYIKGIILYKPSEQLVDMVSSIVPEGCGLTIK